MHRSSPFYLPLGQLASDAEFAGTETLRAGFKNQHDEASGFLYKKLLMWFWAGTPHFATRTLRRKVNLVNETPKLDSYPHSWPVASGSDTLLPSCTIHHFL